jgi:hypothetical protein
MLATIEGRTASERHVSDYTERLDTKRLDMESLGLPPARMPGLVRHFYRSARRLVRTIIARIDLSQFPGSCCG